MSLATLAAAVMGASAAGPLAARMTDLAALDARVAAFTGAAIGEPGGAMQPIDRRLRLRACAAEPLLGWLGARRDVAVVQCPDAGGWRIFVPLAAAQASVPGQPQPALINRGDSVTIAVSGDGFAVSQPGEALDSGAQGVWIRVRSLRGAEGRAAQPMRARVIQPGLVRVDLP